MTFILKEEGNRKLPFDEQRLRGFIQNKLGVNDKKFEDKIVRTIKAKETYNAKAITKLIINTALENVDEVETHWTYVAAKAYLFSLYKEASKNRSYDAKDKYGDFYGLQKKLAGMGIYSKAILEKYSREEIKELSKIIDPSKDLLFDYTGLYLLSDRYLATDHKKNVYELPQERFLTIAMTLMQNEPKEKRLDLVKEAYWALSNLYMTVATPTLANSGMAHGQLSSCFIDTVEDSLDGIYLDNWDIARLSKDGGGIGVYYGKVRAKGSTIKNYENASSGVVPWIKQLNNTAVSVDQLGQRKGAVAVYLDVFHADVEAFLDLRLNNGDERQRAHDIFLGLSVPDLFMEAVENRGDWYLFDPHEVKKVMGWKDDEGNPLGLEDYYDEEKGSGTFREKYEEAVSHPTLKKHKVKAIDIMARAMKSQLETGTPFMFYRDEVNRMNPNKKFRKDGTGITTVFCSNLCTEITQNQSPTTIVSEVVVEENGEYYTILKRKHGEFVVCNLSSINLGRAVPAGVLPRLIPLQVRMLDNVIDINKLEVRQAGTTNQKYRAVGLGTFGWHHLLALQNIEWESERALDYVDEVYEQINFLAIKASMELAKERGAYPMFEGSEWQNGKYFDRREYHNGNSKFDWDGLKAEVAENGIRNGYLMAVAPNASTAKIGGSTDGIDPVFKPFFYDEKKDYKNPVVAPDLDHRTYNIYRRSAYILDQRWSVRQNARRQRHIDQSISFNFYVPKNIKAKFLLGLHLQSWKEGLKTTYYVRSTTTKIEECEWCAS